MNTIKLNHIQRQTGFTLTELLIALSVTTILVALAAPTFNDFIQQTRLINATHELHSAMNLARMEAIKRNGRVDLIAHGGSWKNGWMIVVNNQPIFNHEALHSDIHVNSNFTSKAKTYIAYNGTGRTRTDAESNRSQSGSIRLSIGNNSRLIVVNFLGRIRICNPATAPKGTCTGATSVD